MYIELHVQCLTLPVIPEILRKGRQSCVTEQDEQHDHGTAHLNPVIYDFFPFLICFLLFFASAFH